ncbi:hypothetical protein BDB00DRAFT_796020 [Zychaea mexicana]|uniref:uncharacterized protein n=1 Tax=Zychaea mexicana TaxID=64656 RepID=UPI0022FE1773|nr:uncharacterized protein BDB00DRAFT_796020 [Zychaea mexicana]KAI9499247.1 hypothetical protein BDB00DRAFT_796020 [Zychaea mexicana]
MLLVILSIVSSSFPFRFPLIVDLAHLSTQWLNHLANVSLVPGCRGCLCGQSRKEHHPPAPCAPVYPHRRRSKSPSWLGRALTL